VLKSALLHNVFFSEDVCASFQTHALRLVDTSCSSLKFAVDILDSRKISAHLFDWFKQPVTAKEPDADAFGTRPQVKRKYDTCMMTSEKGKKQSEDDIKKRRRTIEIKYWVANPLEAVEDELINRMHVHANNISKQPVAGFKFPLLDTPTVVTCFLADHGNIAWRAGLTVIANEQDGQGGPVKVAHLLGKDS
jgi:hypothetical protein